MSKENVGNNELLGMIASEFPRYVEEGVKEKGFNKADCYDKFAKDYGMYENNLLVSQLVEAFDMFDDVFYNVLETTDAYKNLMSNMDSCSYNDDSLKHYLQIDTIMEITKQFNLSLEEVDKMLASHELKLYLNDVSYVRRRITEISSEKLSELLNMQSYDLLRNETILDAAMRLDNAIKAGSNLIVRLDIKEK